MIEKLKAFVKSAGQYSAERRCAAEHKLSFKAGAKAAKGIVTEVDMAISQMFKQFVAENFSDLNYMIIDEESIDEIKGMVFETCAKTDYQFVIDPIDGTMNYAADIPLYGITIGVLKKGKPWLGVLYAPATGELVYTDGAKVYYEYNGKVKILPKNCISTSRVVLGHSWRMQLKPDHFDGNLIMHDYFSAVIYLIYLAVGRVRGAFMQAYLWDIAGGWAVLDVLGMGFYDYYTKQKMTDLSSQFFLENCRVRGMNIVCFDQDFDELKNLTTGLTESSGG